MSSTTDPLVSVIIPCYNHGQYLQQAIDSINVQTYQHIELIVVDDGSVDSTKSVAAANQQVRYIFQLNQGLSAARNTGIRHSSGDFLLFLDADDLLYPDAIAINVQLLLQHPDVAFVSGGHNGVDHDLTVLWTTQRIVADSHYRHFLRWNYIGMHATVLYRRHIFDKFQFDTSLRACEDYDLYLSISAHYPVLHHQCIIAAYRQHQSNMSSDAVLMLTLAHQVLKRHENSLTNTLDKKAYKKGITFWGELYCEQMYFQLVNSQLSITESRKNSYLKTLYNENYLLYLKYHIVRVFPIKSYIKRVIPSSIVKSFRYKLR
ncbi:glycosyltransferase [Fibrella sp. USSR17]